MRGGRNMAERDAKTGQRNTGRIVLITVLTRFRTGRPFGSPWNPQHQQIPLQVSGVAGSGWVKRACGVEDATGDGPSHRSQYGE